ncbi:MAG: addiction module protein [Deltaproteobacteria bacterium]|nr:addiction module protein [Deltaproteobacteria bacterium]
MKIVSEALGLPPHARAFVVEKLIESLDASHGEEISPVWREEIQKRCRELDAGLVELGDAAVWYESQQATLGKRFVTSQECACKFPKCSRTHILINVETPRPFSPATLLSSPIVASSSRKVTTRSFLNTKSPGSGRKSFIRFA